MSYSLERLEDIQRFAETTIMDIWTRYHDEPDHELLAVCMIAVGFARRDELTREDLVTAINDLFDSAAEDE